MDNYTEFLTALRQEPPEWRKIESLLDVPVYKALQVALVSYDICKTQAVAHWDAYRVFRAERGEESPNMEYLEAREESGDATLVDRAFLLFNNRTGQDRR